MDDKLTPLLLETSDTVSANAISDNCNQSCDRHNCCEHEVPTRNECHSCNDIGSEYNELYYVTKFKKCDEYCCAKKGCDCDTKPEYDYCGCEEKPNYDCGCESKRKHDCCYEEKPKYDCGYEEKPKYDCCYEERPKYDCCYEEKPKYDCCCKEKPKCVCCCEEKPKCDCGCKEKPKCVCCCEEKPKCDCGCKEKPKCVCCHEEKRKCDCGCKEKKKHDCCECNSCKEDHCYYPPTKSCLKCSTPGGASIPLGTLAGTTFVLTSVSIDTSKFKKPCIDFSFASNIIATAAISSVSFQIFKQCKCQFNSIPVGPAWTFSNLVTAVSVSDTFSFGVCDCDSCNNECCTYSVVAIVTGVATVGTIAINNATLSALIVDKSACNC